MWSREEDVSLRMKQIEIALIMLEMDVKIVDASSGGLAITSLQDLQDLQDYLQTHAAGE